MRKQVLVILIVILLAGIARITLALQNYHALNDEVLVMEMATQLLKGQGYTLEWVWFPALAGDGWPQPDPQLMPLLPTLVATTWLVVGQSVPVANAVVAGLAAGCVLVVFLLGWRLFGPGTGFLAVIVMLVNVRYLHVSITCLTSPVYGLFLTLAIWAFLEAIRTPSRQKWVWPWVLLGLAAGVAWLTRPEGPLILPALGLTTGYLWWRRREIGSVRRLVAGFLLATVLFVVVASPLIAYNLTSYGTLVHASSKVNLWAWNNEARFAATPPTAESYWARHTLGDFVTGKAQNLAWMLTLMAEYLTWPAFVLLLAAAGWVLWHAQPLTAVVIYTLVFLTASLSQRQMSLWPGSQYFMYYSSLLPLWAVLIAGGMMATGRTICQALSRRWPARAAVWTAVVIMAGVLILLPMILTETRAIIYLASWVSQTRTAEPEPRIRDCLWMADHLAPEAAIMTMDVMNLHWYSNHRRTVMIPTDDARIIQEFMRRFGVTHLYYSDWLVGPRPAFALLRDTLHTQADLGPYSILQPVHAGDWLLFQVDLAGPPAILLVSPNAATEEGVAQTWLRYAVTDAVPADVSAYPAVVASDEAPGLAGRYRPAGVRFGAGIELLGYEVPAARPGESLHLTLYWRCVAPVKADYTVFNHLLDPSGAWVAQQDGPPASGLYPTSWWHPGEVIVDRHTIVVPADTPPSDYQLAVGLYDFATMQRVPVQGGGDAVTLASVPIGRQP